MIKKIMKIGITTALCAAFCISSPISSYAYGCDYSYSLWEPISGQYEWVTNRLDNYNEGIYISTKTSASVDTQEWVNFIGWKDGIYMDYFTFDPVYRKFIATYDREEQEQSTFLEDLYGVDIYADSAQADFGVCLSGNWNWVSTIWQ